MRSALGRTDKGDRRGRLRCHPELSVGSIMAARARAIPPARARKLNGLATMMAPVDSSCA